MAEADVDLLDYEEEEAPEAGGDATKEATNGVVKKKEGVKGNYVSIHSSGFRLASLTDIIILRIYHWKVISLLINAHLSTLDIVGSFNTF